MAENITTTVGRYVRLLLEDARLSAAEKLTRLLAAVALAAILIIFGTVALLFVSLGVSQLLAESMNEMWAYLIVAAFYVVAFAVLILARRTLLVDPIARFVSKLILPPPSDPDSHE